MKAETSASFTDWFQGVIGASHYFGPLLWLHESRLLVRPHWPAAYCDPSELGRGIAGQRHSPMEPMQLLPGLGRDEPVPDYELTSNSCRIAITWWTNRLTRCSDTL